MYAENTATKNRRQGDRQEKVVGMQSRKKRHPFPARIERAVAIEQAFFVDAANHAPESEVL
jgi:hypothetical protein